jgi:hypothetical protein
LQRDYQVEAPSPAVCDIKTTSRNEPSGTRRRRTSSPDYMLGTYCLEAAAA